MGFDFLPDTWGLTRLVHGDNGESDGARAAELPIPDARAAASGGRGTQHRRLCKGTSSMQSYSTSTTPAQALLLTAKNRRTPYEKLQQHSKEHIKTSLGSSSQAPSLPLLLPSCSSCAGPSWWRATVLSDALTGTNPRSSGDTPVFSSSCACPTIIAMWGLVPAVLQRWPQTFLLLWPKGALREGPCQALRPTEQDRTGPGPCFWWGSFLLLNYPVPLWNR